VDGWVGGSWGFFFLMYVFLFFSFQLNDLALKSHFLFRNFGTDLSFSWFYHVAFSIVIDTSVSFMVVYCLEVGWVA
jgi:hypothetical protein